MQQANRTLVMVLSGLALIAPRFGFAQDWPQWRGPNRDGKTTGFKAPDTWPKELTQEWSVSVGDGVATPALVENKLYVFSRQDGNEIIRCLDAATGEEKWKWTGDGPAYGSPVLMDVDGTRAIMTPTDKSMVAISVADGSLLWKVPYSQGRYNAATPIVAGQSLITAGPGSGITAEKIVKQGAELSNDQLWSNPDNTVQFNTPVLKEERLIGLSNVNRLFCINVQNGQTAWAAPLGAGPNEEAAPSGGGGRGRGRGRGGYGSVVDTGSVLLALSPSGELIVFESPGDEFKQLASFKVASGGTYACPVVSGNRVFVKDQDSLTLWTIE